MTKIKKLWKVLAGSISWNLKAPNMSNAVMKESKKCRQKQAREAELKQGFAG